MNDNKEPKRWTKAEIALIAILAYIFGLFTCPGVTLLLVFLDIRP